MGRFLCWRESYNTGTGTLFPILVKNGGEIFLTGCWHILGCVPARSSIFECNDKTVVRAAVREAAVELVREVLDNFHTQRFCIFNIKIFRKPGAVIAVFQFDP